jgi:hypothetical protein
MCSFSGTAGTECGRAISGATHNNYAPWHTHVAVSTLWYLQGDPTIIFRALNTLFAEEQSCSEQEA